MHHWQGSVPLGRGSTDQEWCARESLLIYLFIYLFSNFHLVKKKRH